jgi:hypothetical protein
VSYIPPGGSGYFPPLVKRTYTKLLGKTFDLKISHKKLIFPNQIKILGVMNGVFAKGKQLKNLFEVQNTVTGNIQTLTYYTIQRYYLGKSFKRYSVKGNRVSLQPFQIVSNPKVPFNQLYTRKFDILGKTRRRAWKAEGLTEEQIKAKEQEIKDRPAEPYDPSYEQPDCVLYVKDTVCLECKGEGKIQTDSFGGIDICPSCHVKDK